MSTAIWENGAVLASVALLTCDRCSGRRRCIQLSERGRNQISLCDVCFRELIGKAFAFAAPAGTVGGLDWSGYGPPCDHLYGIAGLCEKCGERKR